MVRIDRRHPLRDAVEWLSGSAGRAAVWLKWLSGPCISLPAFSCSPPFPKDGDLMRRIAREPRPKRIVDATSYITRTSMADLSLEREGSSVAPPTRRTAHRTRTQAGPSHAPRHAEHADLFLCAAVVVELEREPDEGYPVSPAWSPSIGEEAKESEVDAKKPLSAAQGASKVVSNLDI